MSNFLESKKIRAVLWILGGLILLFTAFGMGITVGYDRAGFASGFDRNYYRMFFGGPPGYAFTAPAGSMPASMPMAIHGVVGTVIDIGTSTISVENQNSAERSVVVPSGTDIRTSGGGIAIGDIAIGDTIAVIGAPNDQGQIVARFIRVFPASSSIPMPQQY